MIANAGSDERRRISGGSAGDQTGDEYRVRSWYNRPWSYVCRPKSQAVGDMIAEISRKAANNSKIGYDQNQRLTYYNRLRDANWHPENITSACETDCSASSAAAVIAAGHRLGISALTSVSSSSYSGNIGSQLTSTGQFTKLTASKYLTSDNYLLPGDILIYTNHHVAVNLDPGSKANYTASSSGSAEVTRSIQTVCAKTKDPTGLSISRDGDVFTFSWKIADSNHSGGQQVCYELSHSPKKYVYITIGTSDTSASITLSRSNYYPNTKTKLEWIKFWVRGKRGDETSSSTNTTYEWSGWPVCQYNIWRPNMPVITTSGNYSEDANATTFTWNTETSDTDHRWFTDVEMQSILLTNCEVPEHEGKTLTGWSSSNIGWGTMTTSANSSWKCIEDSYLTELGSYTRWVRARARGPWGDGYWVYKCHVYATPNRPVVKQVELADAPSLGIRCKPAWVADQPVSRPIDKTTVQYTITYPTTEYKKTEDTTPKDGKVYYMLYDTIYRQVANPKASEIREYYERTDFLCPPGASWTDARSSTDTGGWDAASFLIDNRLQDDECLFIRVKVEHDARVTISEPYLAKIGSIARPSGLTINVDGNTYRATITATNNSQNPSSDLVVEYKPASWADKPQMVQTAQVGIIPHGANSVQVQCPNWDDEEYVSFGVFSMVGRYWPYTNSDGFTSYAINCMRGSQVISSETIWGGGDIPLPPSDLKLTQVNDTTIKATWSWSWKEANSAEISWADHDDAWSSTDEPTTYTISNQYTSDWNIAGLTVGKTWYVRVRLIKKNGEDEVHGPWSKIEPIDLRISPLTPTLWLSENVIKQDGTVKCSWAYTSRDGTSQLMAQICEATITDDGITYGRIVGETQTAQHIDINAYKVGWQNGQTYNLCVRVLAGSMAISEWSNPVTLTVANPITATVYYFQDSMRNNLRPRLTSMPFEIGISSSVGHGAKVSVIIERAEAYSMERPNEDIYDGQEGETVLIYVQEGDERITVSNDMLLGYLDDGCKYRCIVTVSDEIGQTWSATKTVTVDWDHKALMPNAIEQIDLENYVAYIVPVTDLEEDTVAEGDVCDIYRLSADKPELIVQNGSFNVQYVDPYPTLGPYGGHRIVYKTANGDYITENNILAWADIGTGMDVFALIIDFDQYRAVLPYNIAVSHSWKKDFQETQYLGGSVQGDWNLAVSRTSSISTSVAVELDSDTVQVMRRLADYPGVCHVRTPDGSSFTANVEVNESREEKWVSKLATFDLDITRVDAEGFDGMTYDEYAS